MQFQCRPMQYNTLQSQSLSSHNIALQNRCFAPLHQTPMNCALAFLCTAFPFLFHTERYLTLLCLRYALLHPTMPLLFRAHRGDSFRCPAIACHCFSILRLHYAKRLPAAPFQRYASLHFSIALPRYASPREASAVLLVPKQNSAYPMQFLAVRRSTSPLLSLALPRFSFAWRSGAGRCRCHASQIFAVPSPF